MDSIVQLLADVYDAITFGVARGAYWLSVLLLVVAAVGAVAMVLDLLVLTPPRRFRTADRAAQPSDGIVLIGQLMAGASLAAGPCCSSVTRRLHGSRPRPSWVGRR